MNQLEVLRESLGQCDEIVLDALLMRNRIVEDILPLKYPIHPVFTYQRKEIDA